MSYKSFVYLKGYPSVYYLYLILLLLIKKLERGIWM